MVGVFFLGDIYFLFIVYLFGMFYLDIRNNVSDVYKYCVLMNFLIEMLL